jgi:hypothetical protein
LLHPFGDSNKSIETGVQSSLQPVYAMSTAGNRTNAEMVNFRSNQEVWPSGLRHWS